LSFAKPRVRQSRDLETEFDAAIIGAVFSDAGVLAAALGDGTVRLIAADHNIRTVQVHDGAALCLALDLDGQSFITGGDDGRLVRTSTDGEVAELMSAPGQQIDVLAMSRPAKARAVAIGKEVRLLDAAGVVRARAADHPSTVAGLAFNPKGRRLAVAHYGGVTLWWTATLGRSPHRLDWRGSHIGVSWSPDGSYVVTAMQERELHGWRAADGEDLAMRGYSAKIRSTDWLARPPILATAGADCVTLWSFAGAGPQGRAPIELCQRTERLVTRVAIHPTQSLVAAGFDDGCVAVCEMTRKTGDRVFPIRPGKGGRVTMLVWSPDGTRLAIGTEQGALSLFDLSHAAS
jgi:WD40 repeat protein